MNYIFIAPAIGRCMVTLWATGRYGFSLPKKVEIMTPAGTTSTFLYVNRKLRLHAEPSNRVIVKLAIARFLEGVSAAPEPIEIDPELPAYEGELIQVRTDTSRSPLRVRPGKVHARARAGEVN